MGIHAVLAAVAITMALHHTVVKLAATVMRLMSAAYVATARTMAVLMGMAAMLTVRCITAKVAVEGRVAMGSTSMDKASLFPVKGRMQAARQQGSGAPGVIGPDRYCSTVKIHHPAAAKIVHKYPVGSLLFPKALCHGQKCCRLSAA